MQNKMTVKEKIEKWVKENPNGYLDKSYEAIGEEIGLPGVTVWRNLPNIIAERDNILPSDVKKLREENRLIQSANKITDDTVEEIVKYHKEGIYTIEDIAFMIDLDVRTVQKYLIREYSKSLTAEEIAEKLKIKVKTAQKEIEAFQKKQTK